MDPLETVVSVGPTYGKKIGNIILEKARFFGRPNFSGAEDRFKDTRRKFTVLIPNDCADQLREAGWNVKTNIPTEEELREFPDREPISHLKVMVDHIDIDEGKGPEVFVKMGEDTTQLTDKSLATLDRSRFEVMDMEIRAWEFDPEDHPGEYSARLVQFIGVMQPNRLAQKYGFLIGKAHEDVPNG